MFSHHLAHDKKLIITEYKPSGEDHANLSKALVYFKCKILYVTNMIIFI